MATIDYKEKYEQAMERARQFIEKPYLEDSAGIVRHIFPELAESEDERIRKWLIGVLSTYEHDRDLRNAAIAWLEKQSKDSSVLSNSSNIGKDEQKPAWSEEDEYTLLDTIRLLCSCGKCSTDRKLWLLSLKDRVQPQSQWKPTGEQMKYLAKAIATLGDEGDCKTASILNDLRVELKKLREE